MTPSKKQEQQKPAVQPQAATAHAAEPQAPEVAPSKQEQTLNQLKEAWAKRGVELGKLEVKPDGKFLMVTVATNWPLIKIGPTGGIDLPTIKSYAKAFDAAVNGDQLLKKQQERMAKKQAASAPAPAAKPDVKVEAAKQETPT